MPICFKCGKDLATDQSLKYHLNKRVPCTSLYCKKCNKQFPNKIVFDTHIHSCQANETVTKDTTDRHKIYDMIKSDKVFLIEIDENDFITYSSSNRYQKRIKISDIISDEYLNYLKVPDETFVLKISDMNCNTRISKHNNIKLLTNTIIT